MKQLFQINFFFLKYFIIYLDDETNEITTERDMMKTETLISSGQEGKVMHTDDDHEFKNKYNNEEVDNDYNAKKKISSFYPQMGSWQGFKKVKLSTVKPTTKSTVQKSTTTPKTTTKKSTTETTTTTVSSTSNTYSTADTIEERDDRDDNYNKDNNNVNLHVKLAELLDHNSRLVDIIRATLQIQWTLFSKIISFIIPQ